MEQQNKKENQSEESLYAKVGVSYDKKDVHKAIANVDKGIFPGAFCKIIPDVAGDPTMCSIIHADGAGTKSSLAYMMYKETGDLNYFRGLVHDSVGMNIDDMACVGVSGNVIISNTIGRNKTLIDGSIIATIIEEYELYTKKLTDLGFSITTCGGETADVGDLVRTLIVDSTTFARMKRSEVITPESVKHGDVIVGLASFGKATYEEKYNSGIGSNGLTLARHGLISHQYYSKYPECYDPNIEEKYIFFGKYGLLDRLPKTNLSIGEALLSPTRSYTPILKDLFTKDRSEIHAIYHCTGGGQTKCKNFGKGIHYLKNNLFKIPPLFETIQESSQTPWKEMYAVFNMGHRMEIICSEAFANEKVIPVARSYGVDAQIVGSIEKTNQSKNTLTIESEFGIFEY